MKTAENTRYIITLGGNRTIAEVVAGSCYSNHFNDNLILERYTLVQGPKRKATIEIFSIEHFDHDPTDAEIEAEYARHGLKPPTVDHAIHFGN